MRSFIRVMVVLLSLSSCYWMLGADDLQALPRQDSGGEAEGAAATGGKVASPQKPSSACAEVIYKGGKLSIQSENCLLSDILEAVHTQIGAAVEAPPFTAQSRLTVHISPGDPLDVLADLLDRSGFYYSLSVPAESPVPVERIVLMPRTTTLAQSATAVPAPSSKKNTATSGADADTASAPEESAKKKGDTDGKTADDTSSQQSSASVPAPDGLSPDQLQRLFPSFFGGLQLSGSTASGATGSGATGGNSSFGTTSASPTGAVAFYPDGNPIIPGMDESTEIQFCNLYGMNCRQLYNSITSSSPPQTQQPTCTPRYNARTQSFGCS